MKNVFFSTFLAGAVAVSASVASAQTPIVEENFESYADTAALTAVWGGTPNYQLMTDGGHSGDKYVRHPSTTTNPGQISRAINAKPTDEAPLEVSFWARAASSVSGRAYMQLEAPSTQLINFGNFNNPGGSKWNYRTLGGGAPGAWTASSASIVADRWDNLKVVVKSRAVTYYVNDVQVAEETRTTSDWPAFTALKFGFTAGAGTTTTDFDDITLKQVSSVNDWNLY